MAPPAPVDLTAEEASDTNEHATEDRGVLLLWNEPMDGGGITSYVIERRIDGGDADGMGTAIGQIVWTAATSYEERTSYTDSREPVEGEMLEYRVGSRGATTVDETNWSGWIEFTTHAAMHMPTPPTGVTATANSATAVTVNWMTPADNGGSDITGFTVRWKQSDATELRRSRYGHGRPQRHRATW